MPRAYSVTERSYRMVLPKFDNDGHRIDNSRLEPYAVEMSRHFGGVTVYPTVVGCYVPKDGELHCEENALLESARDIPQEDRPRADEIFKRDKEFMRRLADRAGREFGQESVFVEEDIIKDVEFRMGKMTPSVPKRLREVNPFYRLL